EIGWRENRPDAWYPGGLASVDSDYAGPGFRAAHESPIEHARELDVKGIACSTSHLVESRPSGKRFADGLQGLGRPPGCQPGIAHLQDMIRHRGLCHDYCPPICGAAASAASRM